MESWVVYPSCFRDQMNELLNRWRHGEVNLLQRRFRLARAQSVKPTVASKLLGGRAPTSTSAPTNSASANTTSGTNPEGNFVEEERVSPSPGEDRLNLDTRVGDGVIPGTGRGGTVNDQGENARIGVGGGSARAGMEKDTFMRVFTDLQVRVSVMRIIWACQHHAENSNYYSARTMPGFLLGKEKTLFAREA